MIYHVDFKAIGSSIRVALECSDSEKSILEQVPTWFERWEDSLSRFRPDSELSRVNRGNGRFQRVSPILWDALKTSLDMEERSQGLVTPGILSALNAAGYDRSFEVLSGSILVNPIAHVEAQPVADLILFREADSSIRIPAGLELDFGGVGKGWAANQTSLALEKIGPVLVDAGGDISLKGLLSDGRGWPVGIENLFDPEEEITQLELTDCGIATSGKNRRKWLTNAGWMHHILDPRTGLPAENDVLSATVLAPNAMLAEMAAKMINILGSENGLDWLDQQPDMEALAVLAGGEIRRSEGFAQYERISA